MVNLIRYFKKEDEPMKRETKERIKTGWYRFCNGVKEIAPAFAIGGIIGAAITGYIGAIDNSIKINKLKAVAVGQVLPGLMPLLSPAGVRRLNEDKLDVILLT